MVSGTNVVFGAFGVEAFVILIVVLVMLLSVLLFITMLLFPSMSTLCGSMFLPFK